MKKRLGGIYGGEGGNKCINKSIKIFRAGSALILAPSPDKKKRKQHLVNPSIQQCLEDEPTLWNKLVDLATLTWLSDGFRTSLHLCREGLTTYDCFVSRTHQQINQKSFRSLEHRDRHRVARIQYILFGEARAWSWSGAWKYVFLFHVYFLPIAGPKVFWRPTGTYKKHICGNRKFAFETHPEKLTIMLVSVPELDFSAWWWTD